MIKPATTNDYPVVGFCENVRYSSFRNDDNSKAMAFIIYGEDHKDWEDYNIINIRVSPGADKSSDGG